MIPVDVHLENGERRRMDCPNCGGRSTFTISNIDGTYVWNCFKLTCKLTGNERMSMSATEVMSAMDRLKGKKETKEEFKLPEYVVRSNDNLTRFADGWGIDGSELMYDARDNRAVFLVKDNDVVVDATGRAIAGGYPKWKRYGNSSVPYNYGKNKNTAILVEDCVSATVAGLLLNCTGIALQGTTLPAKYREYLLHFCNIIVALDPDAGKKNLDMVKELRPYTNSVYPFRLTDDLKYRNEDDIKKLYRMTDQWN